MSFLRMHMPTPHPHQSATSLAPSCQHPNSALLLLLPADLTQLLKDTDYQQELFVVVNAVFDEDVLAAIDSGAKTLGSEIAALLEGAGILPAGSSTILTGEP